MAKIIQNMFDVLTTYDIYKEDWYSKMIYELWNENSKPKLSEKKPENIAIDCQPDNLCLQRFFWMIWVLIRNNGINKVSLW